MPVMLDLFCGLGGASAAMRERGWTVIGVDNRPELEPDVLADIATYRYDGPPVDFLWASPPCTEFAKWDKRCWYPDAPAPGMALVDAALRLVAEVRPRWWLLENVRGARSWFAPLLGPVVLQRPPTYLWGSPPPGLLLPPPRTWPQGILQPAQRRSAGAAADIESPAQPTPRRHPIPDQLCGRSGGRARAAAPGGRMTTKADYVRAEARKGNPGGHSCHAQNCNRGVAPAYLMCPRHWRMVPPAIQRAIWDHFRGGQERDKRPTREYLAALRAAVDAVAQAESQGRKQLELLP